MTRTKTNTTTDTNNHEITYTTPDTGTVTLPYEINRFETVTGSHNTHGPTVYTANDGTDDRVHVTFHNPHETRDADTHVIHLTAYDDVNGSEIQHRRIPYGPGTDRDAITATDAVEKQLWEWGRYPLDDMHDAVYAVTDRGYLDPWDTTTSLDDRDAVPDTWWYSHHYKPDRKVMGEAETDYGFNRSRTRYMPHSRIEFNRTSESGGVLFGKVTVAFYHESFGDGTVDAGRVYGACVTARTTEFVIRSDSDTGEQYYEREYTDESFTRFDSDESMRVTDLIAVVDRAKQWVAENAVTCEDMRPVFEEYPSHAELCERKRERADDCQPSLAEF